MRWDSFIFIFSLLAIMVTNTAFRKSRLGKFILENFILVYFKTGEIEGIIFFKKTLDLWGLSFYPWKFWTKQSSTLGDSVELRYTLWSPLEIALLFQLTLEFQHDISSIPQGSSMSWTLLSPAPVWISSSLFDHFEEGTISKRGRTTLGWKYGSEVKRS